MAAKLKLSQHEKLWTIEAQNWQVKFVSALQSGFIVPHVWEIVGIKVITIFEGCH